jgi:hypothetical protein
MRIAWIAAVSALALTGSLASAQNAKTSSTKPPGDAAVSPAMANPAGGSSRNDRPSPGAGINSGALNNGTTGDTIGTGSGTSGGPATGMEIPVRLARGKSRWPLGGQPSENSSSRYSEGRDF